MFHAGDLVGLLETREPKLAVVESVQGSKYRIRVGFTAKQQVVARRHLELIYSLPNGDDPPSRLGVPPWSFSEPELDQARPSRREWASAWVLLSESDETLALDAFADLVCAADRPIHRVACWLALHHSQWMFRFKQGVIEARSSDELKHLRQEERRQRLNQARRQACIDLFRQGEAIQPDCLDHQQALWMEQIKEMATGRLDYRTLEDEVKIILKELHLDNDTLDLYRMLIKLGQIDPHQLPAMQASRWSSGFSPELEALARQLVADSETTKPGDEKRLDLCHLHCVTIDDVDTRDIDDGLSLERKDGGSARIWIHVADPGRLIEAGSALDQEAMARGSSLYLAQGIQSMFPSCLATGPFSLRSGRRNPAWSTWVELNPDGAIEAYGIIRSWVKPLYKLSYEDADELIDLAPPEEADLADLDHLLKRRKHWRETNGALMMELPEGRFRCRDNKASLEITEPSPSRLMVAEAMILAGAAAAQFGIDHSVAMPFRSQLPAELPSPGELDELPEGAVRFAAIKRCLSRGLMGTKPAAHFSLGLPAYVQATSPIRRYGDLIVQRQILATLNNDLPLSEDVLQDLVNQVDHSTREGIGISREDQRHWQQVWFESHSEDHWQADFLRWLRPQDRLGLIRIDALAIDLPAECPAGCSPGDDLTVEVIAADSACDQLKLRGR